TSRANQDNSPRINRGTGYDNQRISNVARARETVGTTVVQKSRIQCYNCKEFGHVVRECQKLKRVKDAAYHKEKMLLCKQEEVRFQLNAEQADWRDDTDDEPEDQELEAHYMYMAQIQEVTPNAADNYGPIFDIEPLQKVQHNDHYNVFAIESEHPEQSKSVHDTYPTEQDKHNVIINSLYMSYDREQIDQNDDDDDDDDLANERDLLASLIEKLKCEIDDSKNRNKFLETSNKVFVDKLKGLESIEARLIFYKKNKFVYEEDIKVLKREIHLREVAITELRRKLELAQKQKDKIQLTVENFENSSKNLSKLIDCQIVGKYKTGLGYNAVPPPYTRNFLPPKPDLSSLEEFVNELIVTEPKFKKPVVETSKAKVSADKPKVVRKNFGPLLTKDWISDSEDEAKSKSKIEKKIVKTSFAKIKLLNLKSK
nr:hypothetical protein [Tanacetum cinerariifolium]